MCFNSKTKRRLFHRVFLKLLYSNPHVGITLQRFAEGLPRSVDKGRFIHVSLVIQRLVNPLNIKRFSPGYRKGQSSGGSRPGVYGWQSDRGVPERSSLN